MQDSILDTKNIADVVKGYVSSNCEYRKGSLGTSKNTMWLVQVLAPSSIKFESLSMVPSATKRRLHIVRGSKVQCVTIMGIVELYHYDRAQDLLSLGLEDMFQHSDLPCTNLVWYEDGDVARGSDFITGEVIYTWISSNDETRSYTDKPNVRNATYVLDFPLPPSGGGQNPFC